MTEPSCYVQTNIIFKFTHKIGLTHIIVCEREIDIDKSAFLLIPIPSSALTLLISLSMKIDTSVLGAMYNYAVYAWLP